MNRFRSNYIQGLLESEKGELSTLDQEVLDSLKRHETLASNVDDEYEKTFTLGERMADRLADFGGSWNFIVILGSVSLGWIVVNTLVLVAKPFDPYPFIFLNLILSCLAAIQAPVIMMSQNRQEAKDRRRSEHDYQINLKAELEIRHLHERLDHLLSRQWERLVAIQQVQLDVLSENRSYSGQHARISQPHNCRPKWPARARDSWACRGDENQTRGRPYPKASGQTGGPEVLKIEQVEVPSPGPGEVRIAVKALGLNRAEVMFRSGQYLEQPTFPARLGYEAAGTVEALGQGVHGLRSATPSAPSQRSH